MEGTVRDPSGAAIPQARVVVTGSALQGQRSSVSDDRGRFHLPALPVGVYEVRISRLGLRELVLEGIVVSLGRTTELGDVQLESEAIEITGTTVVAPAPAPTSRPTTMGGSLSSSMFRALPTDRDYQSIVTLLPHASVSYFGDRANLSGASGPESNYYVDGVNVVEPPGNARSTSLPYNLIEAVEVRAGGYQAEYGGAGGGIVNAVTASGGNTFKGQLFGFYANRLFTTGSSSVSAKSEDLDSWDVGGSVEGPIVKDRLWFFAAYDPARERESLQMPGFGSVTDQSWSHRFAAKLTGRPDDRTQVVLSALGDPGSHDQVGGLVLTTAQSLGNLDPVLVEQSLGGGSVSLRLTRTLGERAFAEIGGGYFTGRFTFEPRTARGADEPLYVDTRTGYVEGGVGSATNRSTGRVSVRGSLAFAVRDHALKTGVVYEDEFFEEQLSYDQVWRQQFYYQTITLVGRDVRGHIRAPALFVQDAWKVTSSLRLDAGLRWSEEYWVASGGDVGQRIANQWQPRAGFSWRMDQRRASMFGSLGRFYQRTRLAVPGLFLQDLPSTYEVRVYPQDPRTDPSGGTTVFTQTLGHQPEVDGLRGAAFDEVQIGADRVFAGRVHVVARGVYRTQQSGIVAVESPISGQAVYGNPGSGELAPYPEISRVYRALELTADIQGASGNIIGASYVLSSIRGNYEGYWGQSAGVNDPVGAAAFVTDLSGVAFIQGQLPNDRPHQFKLYGQGVLGHGVSVGATLFWLSGTPISELGVTQYGAPYYQFLSPRGSLGRTPSIYDLSLRIAYDPPLGSVVRGRPRMLLDVYHVGNPRRPVVIDQVRFFDTAQTSPNPNYGETLFFQPSVAYRVGLEVRW